MRPLSIIDQLEAVQKTRQSLMNMYRESVLQYDFTRFWQWIKRAELKGEQRILLAFINEVTRTEAEIKINILSNEEGKCV